jgi:hypothetical protein
MKIDGLKLGHLRNDEHFQFMTEVRDAFREADPAALRVEAQFEAFAALYRVEDAVLKKITKSALTAEIHDADAERDRVFRGMADAARSAANHFSPAVAEAAGRLRIVFDAYGNVAAKSADAETSAIHNLLQELAGEQHAADVELVALVPWIAELDRRNVAFEALVQGRYDEAAGRSDVSMKEARAAVDEAWGVLALCVEALWVMAPDDVARAACDALIRRLNAVVAHYDITLARRAGRADAEKAREEAEAAAATAAEKYMSSEL